MADEYWGELEKAPGLLKSNANHFHTYKRHKCATGGCTLCRTCGIFVKSDWRYKGSKNSDMKVYEILIFNRELLDRLKKAGVRLEDAQYIDLYSDYTAMLGNGCKVTYIMAVLAKKYGISERKAYSLVKRFKADCGQNIFGGVKINPDGCKSLAA